MKTRTVVQERAWPCAELSTYVGAYGDADASELPIYVRLAALEGIESHAISSLKAEVGGALLGGVSPRGKSVCASGELFTCA